MNACACMGPMYNEPFCPCVMESRGLERSDEYKEYVLPENVEARNEKLFDALSRYIK